MTKKNSPNDSKDIVPYENKTSNEILDEVVKRIITEIPFDESYLNLLKLSAYINDPALSFRDEQQDIEINSYDYCKFIWDYIDFSKNRMANSNSNLNSWAEDIYRNVIMPGYKNDDGDNVQYTFDDSNEKLINIEYKHLANNILAYGKKFIHTLTTIDPQSERISITNIQQHCRKIVSNSTHCNFFPLSEHSTDDIAFVMYEPHKIKQTIKKDVNDESSWYNLNKYFEKIWENNVGLIISFHRNKKDILKQEEHKIKGTEAQSSNQSNNFFYKFSASKLYQMGDASIYLKKLILTKKHDNNYDNKIDGDPERKIPLIRYILSNQLPFNLDYEGLKALMIAYNTYQSFVSHIMQENNSNSEIISTSAQTYNKKPKTICVQDVIDSTRPTLVLFYLRLIWQCKNDENFYPIIDSLINDQQIFTNNKEIFIDKLKDIITEFRQRGFCLNDSNQVKCAIKILPLLYLISNDNYSEKQKKTKIEECREKFNVKGYPIAQLADGAERQLEIEKAQRKFKEKPTASNAAEVIKIKNKHRWQRFCDSYIKPIYRFFKQFDVLDDVDVSKGENVYNNQVARRQWQFIIGIFLLTLAPSLIFIPFLHDHLMLYVAIYGDRLIENLGTTIASDNGSLAIFVSLSVTFIWAIACCCWNLASATYKSCRFGKPQYGEDYDEAVVNSRSDYSKASKASQEKGDHKYINASLGSDNLTPSPASTSVLCKDSKNSLTTPGNGKNNFTDGKKYDVRQNYLWQSPTSPARRTPCSPPPPKPIPFPSMTETPPGTPTK